MVYCNKHVAYLKKCLTLLYIKVSRTYYIDLKLQGFNAIGETTLLQHPKSNFP